MAILTSIGTFWQAIGIIAQRPYDWKMAVDGWVGLPVYNPPRDPMSIIAATELTKSFAAQDVLQNVSLSIPHQARIALVGPNGVGKTTLLRMIVGAEAPDQGTIQRARKLRIGYLPQEAAYSEQMAADMDLQLGEFVLEAFNEVLEKQRKLEDLEEAMADPARVEQAMERYGPLQEAFENAGGYEYSARIDRTLSGLGFTSQDKERQIANFSGGERTRAQLARLLLDDPDLLALDEPTNHLDVAAIEWLERWLLDWPGAALLVSHDRYFLDRVVDTVWELSSIGLSAYKGNYSEYVQQKSERRLFEEAQYQARQKHVRKEEEYIRRNIAGQNTRQAQGRRKRLERLLRDNKLEKPAEAGSIRIAFDDPSRTGDLVIQTDDLAIGYPDSDDPLYSVPDLALARGDCAALIGPNGAGKSTFLKTLIGEIPPHSGEVHWGVGLAIGYFAQAHSGLDTNNRVLDELLASDPSLRISEARDFAAQFRFRGDDIEKLVGSLSGGERGRLALAKLALDGANLLLLDEPTNHLDVDSQEVLQEALATFPGTILLVSHDRYLIRGLATQIWAIELGNSQLDVFPEGFDSYLEAKRAEDRGASSSNARKARKRKRAQRSDTRDSQLAATELESLEATVAELEEALETLAGRIQAVSENPDELQELSERYAVLEKQLGDHLERWERLVEPESGA